MPSEKEIERKLVEWVKRKGGLCLKFVSPGRRGVTDRIILLPGGKCEFAETKTPEGKLSPPQKRFIAKVKSLGFNVYIIRKPII